MKRTILIEIILLFVLAVLIAVIWKQWDSIRVSIYYYKNYFAQDGYTLTEFNPSLVDNIVLAIFATVACLTTLFVIILIAIKDFPVFQPLVDKLNARKEARNIAKVEKAEQAKQNKIEALEKQLEELKKE